MTTASSQALIYGGDTTTRAMIEFLLAEARCEACAVDDADALATMIQRHDVGLLILIITGNPPDDGAALLSMPHRAGRHLPTLVLTRGRDQGVRRQAFIHGAVDVIGLPASPRELQARLRVALGHANADVDAAPDDRTLRAGGLTLHMASREVSDGTGWRVALTKREAAVLAALMRRPGRVTHRHTVLDHVWGQDYDGDGNALEVYIRRLRTKLAQSSLPSNPVRTLRGQGYVFETRAAPRRLRDARRVDPRRILVVREDEDGEPSTLPTGDPGLVRSLTAILEEAGYVVALCGRAEAARLAGHLRPAAILLIATTNVEYAATFGARLRDDARGALAPLIAVVDAATARAYAAHLTVADVVTVPLKADDLLLRVELVTGPVPGPLPAPAPSPRPSVQGL